MGLVCRRAERRDGRLLPAAAASVPDGHPEQRGSRGGARSRRVTSSMRWPMSSSTPMRSGSRSRPAGLPAHLRAAGRPPKRGRHGGRRRGQRGGGAEVGMRAVLFQSTAQAITDVEACLADSTAEPILWSRHHRWWQPGQAEIDAEGGDMPEADRRNWPRSWLRPGGDANRPRRRPPRRAAFVRGSSRWSATRGSSSCR